MAIIFRWPKILSLVAAFLLSMPIQALADEEAHEEHKESHYHRNHVGLMLGNTHEEGEDDFTVGLDYEYCFTEYVGIGVLLEFVGKEYREGVAMVPLFIHPYKGFRFVAAAGVKPKKDAEKFIWRLGIGYRFPIGGNWTIAPEFNLDFTEGETAEVYGISLGYGF